MDEQNINPTPSKFNFNKVFASIGIILIVIIIISVGIWNLVQNAEDKASKIDETTPITVASDSAKPKTASTSASTLNWKSYSNSTLGVSLKYPDNWGTMDLNGSPIFAPQGFIQQLKGIQEASKMMVLSITQSNTESKYENDQFGTVVKSATTLSGKQATKYVVTYKATPCCNISAGEIYTYIVVGNNGKFTRVSLSDQTYVDTFEMVLSTFKFL